MRDLSTLVNRYRADVAMLAYPAVPAIMTVLRRKRDFLPRRSYASQFFSINTNRPPFNYVCVRYALIFLLSDSALIHLVHLHQRVRCRNEISELRARMTLLI